MTILEMGREREKEEEEGQNPGLLGIKNSCCGSAGVGEFSGMEAW